LTRGEYDRAIAVYSDAIAINPNAADRLADRGYIHFLRGDYPAAAADLHRAIEIFPVSLSNEILAPFRYIARTRAGQDANSELAAMIERRTKILKGTAVPPLHPALDLYLGRSSPEAAVKAASNSLRNGCETDFFVGQWHLMRGDHDEARKRLQAAAHERCNGIDRTYLAAVIELKRMGP
jgi:tetratricopeptide (TPR) repeat protein